MIDYLNSQSTFYFIQTSIETTDEIRIFLARKGIFLLEIVPQNKTTKSIRKCYVLMAARSRLMHDASTLGRRAGQEKYCGVFVVTRQEQKCHGKKGERIYGDMRFIVYFYMLSFCL